MDVAIRAIPTFRQWRPNFKGVLARVSLSVAVSGRELGLPAPHAVHTLICEKRAKARNAKCAGTQSRICVPWWRASACLTAKEGKCEPSQLDVLHGPNAIPHS